ncbi:hypothetical protein X793_03870 [Dehalococcoides mccartyi CG4]|uniref:restriction endonuclease n=1 Tax=Dehalococcoides mccartyi TaxID=61435 RepID=UPI0004E086F5|nr:restriction endonuclease [Dehalococcoides mccartyi]AII60203.1 hypothetical protein X793_03870 [Dehalococcoides mccartyi CG4]
MSISGNGQDLLDYFGKAVIEAFPEADIDEIEEDVWCSYLDVGFRASVDEEEDSLTIIIQFPVPVVKEDELTDEWFYFEMDFSSGRLAQIARDTLISTDRSWEEGFEPSFGCPVDDIIFTTEIKPARYESDLEKKIGDLKKFFNNVRTGRDTNKENAAKAWFISKCKRLGLKSSWDCHIPLEACHDDLVGIGHGMLAGAADEILPSKYQHGRWFLLANDQIAAGERFYFIAVDNKHYAFDNYLVSLARHILSSAVEPMQQITQAYEWSWAFHEERALRIQLKSQSQFNPWFLISPWDLSSARALESGEPLITQRAGLLRAALGESKVPKIDFTNMSYDEFEEFCCDLLIAQGATEIQRRGLSKSRDSGVDISCNYEIQSAFRKQVRKILVQCKKMSKSFGKSDYTKLNHNELLNANNANEFIVMCSSEPTKDVLELALASDGKLQVMGNTRLREEAAKYPEILLKYGAGKANSADN